MSYVKPDQLLSDLVTAGAAKAAASWTTLLARGTLAGALLACATVLAFAASAQTGVPLVGALVFPIGFVIILVLGLELVTGNFALIPLALAERKATLAGMMKNFGVVILGHLLGCAGFTALYLAVITRMGTTHDDPMVASIIAVAEAKTVGYLPLGAAGIALAVIKAILCNWLVSIGAIMSFTSTNTGGKILAMWLPVTLFFALGFEHAVVNMFVIPAGMVLGADITIVEWLGVNQLPVIFGNLVGAVAMTAFLLYFSHRTGIRREPTTAELDALVEAESEPAPRR